MKRSHTKIWNTLKDGMGDKWQACRHEDAVTVGVPDISFSFAGKHGWIEMKSTEDWPKTKPHRFREYTVHQANFLTNRGAVAGNCWVLASVGEDFVMVPWHWAKSLFTGGLPLKKDLPPSWTLWEKKINWEQFMRLLAESSYSQPTF